MREYYGESIAFYFAWMEHYTAWLLILCAVALVVELCTASAYGSSAASADRAAAVTASWYPSDNSSQAASVAAEADDYGAASVGTPVYAALVALWCTLMAEAWKRRQATLAFSWDVAGFEQEERPRPEFIASFRTGPWAAGDAAGPSIRSHDAVQPALEASAGESGAPRSGWLPTWKGMERRRGFYDRVGFVPHEAAPLTLVMSRGARLRVYLLGTPTLLLLTGAAAALPRGRACR